jgi:hypothetical protein
MTRSRRRSYLPRTEWPVTQLDADRQESAGLFRRERLEEPLEDYGEAFDEVQGTVEDLLESTVDLSQLEDQALSLLTNPALREAFRYLAAPPISFDDLKTLVDRTSIAPTTLRKDPQLVKEIVGVIRSVLDRRRFPWVMEGREPMEAERQAAVLASTALIATQRVATKRRNESRKTQEEVVRQALLDQGFTQIKVKGREGIPTLRDAPLPGQFCKEVPLGMGRRKADLVVGLWDGRCMPIECKVSNSSVNSVKRLNNDVAAKAEIWRQDFGSTMVVPVAVLSGVYDLDMLEDAQRGGLTIYWAHRLGDLIQWIEQTRA